MTQSAGRIAASLRQPIVDGWQLCATPAGQCEGPTQLDGLAPGSWIAAQAPGTVAAVLAAAGRWSLDHAARRFDAEDWWYRVTFDAPAAAEHDELWLGFDGLAGVADVWLNGQYLLRGDNMFVAYEREVRGLLRSGSNTLQLRFASLDAALATRRPRPRWRVPMVEHQQLRWFRTTLLGRTPGWSPPVAAVGLWKDVWLERRAGPDVHALELQVRVTADGVGEVELTCAMRPPADCLAAQLVLELRRGDDAYLCTLEPAGQGGDVHFRGLLSVPDVALWWPHTHGEPTLYAAQLRLHLRGSDEALVLPLRPIGFRTLALDTTDGRFALRVNGEPVFCRGACWMPLDVVSLRSPPHACRAAVVQACAAGMNMLRVSGATVYEDEAFFDACDETGMLVWQDFMFANMDYPADDAGFGASVRAEVAQQLAKWQARPSLAVVCGNSEVEQQAAMWGAPREHWRAPLFHATLRQSVGQALADVPYWPSSAHGGAFPHQADVGTSSYFGVGAYLRSVHDARRADLKFATACLALANVPDASTIARMPGGHALRVHHPGWKARAPRDLGAGWDFDDVRDHYLAELFGIDPLRCRYADHDRYLALGRVVSGELMARAFAEWRRPGSDCGGALVWFLRDLWAGAGWGLLDDSGQPKACFHYLRRALQPVTVSITDEGGNGLAAHVVNERAEALDAELQIALFGSGDALIARATHALHVPGRGACSVALAGCFDGFLDLSYAYRFGPPPATLVHVRLCRAGGADIAQAFFFPAGLPSAVHHDIGLTAQLARDGDGCLALALQTTAFAQSVQIELDGHALDDNYFHMAPGTRRCIVARPLGDPHAATAVKVQVSALNVSHAITLRAPP